MKVTWLGQSSYVVESGGQRLLIDPFLSDVVEQRQGLKRLMECPLPMEQLRPDYIVITHDHIDHFDPIALPKIHELYPHASIAGPKSVMQHAAKLKFSQTALRLLPVGQSLQLGPFRLKATPAYHSDPFAIGLVIEIAEKTIYVSGDTVLHQDLIAQVQNSLGKSPDVVFIVINGKLGNMNVEEAGEMVDALRPSLAIPMHYGMFAENTADPELFVQACRKNGVQTRLLVPGEETEI